MILRVLHNLPQPPISTTTTASLCSPTVPIEEGMLLLQELCIYILLAGLLLPTYLYDLCPHFPLKYHRLVKITLLMITTHPSSPLPFSVLFLSIVLITNIYMYFIYHLFHH